MCHWTSSRLSVLISFSFQRYEILVCIQTTTNFWSNEYQFAKPPRIERSMPKNCSVSCLKKQYSTLKVGQHMNYFGIRHDFTCRQRIKFHCHNPRMNHQRFCNDWMSCWLRHLLINHNWSGWCSISWIFTWTYKKIYMQYTYLLLRSFENVYSSKQ